MAVAARLASSLMRVFEAQFCERTHTCITISTGSVFSRLIGLTAPGLRYTLKPRLSGALFHLLIIVYRSRMALARRVHSLAQVT